ncbi:MAG: SCP2 sterol-binding domain-containing protein [Pseudomonadota bacterium]
MGIIDTAVSALAEKMGGAVFDGGTAKFEIEGEGGIIVDADGIRAGDDAADVTLKADVETFNGILSGDVNPTTAFMTGKLSVDGDMGMAMKLAGLLA